MAPPEERLPQHTRVIEAAKRAGVGHVAYTRVVAAAAGVAFDVIGAMSVETERRLMASGLRGRSVATASTSNRISNTSSSTSRRGKIINGAGSGRCAYTSRPELAEAYAQLLTEPRHLQKLHTLAGPPITQAELAEAINESFGTNLKYVPMSTHAYRAAALGPFIGPLIAGHLRVDLARGDGRRV